VWKRSGSAGQGSGVRGFSCLESVQDKAHYQHQSKITLHQGKNSSSLNGKSGVHEPGELGSLEGVQGQAHQLHQSKITLNQGKKIIFPLWKTAGSAGQVSHVEGFSSLRCVQDKAHCQHQGKITVHPGKILSTLNGKGGTMQAGSLCRTTQQHGRCSGSGTPPGLE
jgi:hypothetical protein